MAARMARLLLALALLAGWQLALVHPLNHVDSQGGYVHLGGGNSKDGRSGRADGLCDLIAALAACAPPASADAAPPCCRDASPTTFDAAFLLAAAAPPFFSQGPPASL
jgi:hypothetical protein